MKKLFHISIILLCIYIISSYIWLRINDDIVNYDGVRLVRVDGDINAKYFAKYTTTNNKVIEIYPYFIVDCFKYLFLEKYTLSQDYTIDSKVRDCIKNHDDSIMFYNNGAVRKHTNLTFINFNHLPDSIVYNGVTYKLCVVDTSSLKQYAKEELRWTGGPLFKEFD